MGRLYHYVPKPPVEGGQAPPIDAEPCPVVRLWDWVDRAREAKRLRRSTNLRRLHFDRLIKRALERQRGDTPDA